MKMRTVLCMAAILLAGCASGQIRIEDGATAAEIIQLAQTALDRDRYKLGIQYYEAVLQRFPYNNEAVCGAEYGIAHIHYKQKKYDLAKEEFEDILAKYDAPGGGTLPKKYRVLSGIVLERMASQQKERK